jgi:CRP-like cAMP-binding protein
MDTGRRTGRERRRRDLPVTQNRRSGGERREILRDPDLTAGRLRIVPLFENLSPEQIAALLAVCVKKTYARDDRVFQAGDESNEMYLLVQGKLTVAFPDGRMAASCAPAEIVGETGLFTGERRTATVTASTDCILLTFRRTEVETLFLTDSGLRIRMLTNVIRHLSSRIRKEDVILEGLWKTRSTEAL